MTSAPKVQPPATPAVKQPRESDWHHIYHLIYLADVLLISATTGSKKIKDAGRKKKEKKVKKFR